MALKTDYKDDILDVSQNTKRKYTMIENQDGTVSFDDETVYTQEGDSFGASDINAITEAVNNNSGMPVGTIATFDGTTLPSGFEPYQTEEQRAIAQINDNLAQTPITVGGETLSTIDDKLNFLCENKIAIDEVDLLKYGVAPSATVNFSGEVLVSCGGIGDSNYNCTCTKNGVSVSPIANTPVFASYSGYMRGYVWHFSVEPGDIISCSTSTSASQRNSAFMIMKLN